MYTEKKPDKYTSNGAVLFFVSFFSASCYLICQRFSAMVFYSLYLSLSLALTLVLDAKYWRNKNQTSEKEIFLWKSVNENEGEPENGNGNGKGQGCFFEQVFFSQYENPNGSKERKKVFFAFLLRMKGEAKKEKKKTYRLLYKSLSILQHAIHNFQ